MAADLKPPLAGYALWLLASGARQNQLQSLVDDLSARAGTRRFLAHATLLGLLDYAGESAANIVAEARALAQAAPPLELELVGVGIRNAYFQALFLPIVPTAPLMELHHEARQRFHHEGDPPFLPHVSILYGDVHPAEKLRTFNRITERLPFPVPVTADQLAVVRVDGYPDAWTVEQTFPLGAL